LENLHLTLKFLGGVGRRKLEKVKETLRKINWGNGFEVEVHGVGAFPSENYVRVIWLGLEDEEEMFNLHKQVDFGLSKWFKTENNFLSHVTLSRVKFVKDKEQLKKFLEKYREVDLGRMRINKVVLYESKLRREGPDYIVLEEYHLG